MKFPRVLPLASPCQVTRGKETPYIYNTGFLPRGGDRWKKGLGGREMDGFQAHSKAMNEKPIADLVEQVMADFLLRVERSHP